MNTIRIVENKEPEYIDELMNILMQIRKLQSNPECKLKPIYKKSKTMLLISGPALVIFLCLGILSKDTFLLILSALLAFCMVMIGLSLTSLNKMRRELAGSEGDSLLILDDMGVETHTMGGKMVKIPWNQVAYLRVFSKTVCFIPKNVTGFVIHADKRYAEEIIPAAKCPVYR